jgi:predicted NUDIX family phosphoesterase
MSQEEQILVVPAELAKEAIAHCYRKVGTEVVTDGFHRASESLLPMLQEQAVFVPRTPAEEDPSLKQLIVYALVAYQGRILCYTRGKVGGEARLHAKKSIGIGGHINPEDWDLGALGAQAFRSTLTRELQEEVGILEAHIADVQFLGLVNEDQTDVGRVHLGLVYYVELFGLEGLKFEDALVNPIWVDEIDMRAEDNFELWSVLVRDAAWFGTGAAPRDEVPQRPDYQVRVIEEKRELDERLERLTAFLHSPKFDEVYVEERERLIRQHSLMVDLSAVLGERIAAFP